MHSILPQLEREKFLSKHSNTQGTLREYNPTGTFSSSSVVVGTTNRFFASCRASLAPMLPFRSMKDSTSPNEKQEMSPEGCFEMPASATSHNRHRHRLRNMPFSFEMFQFIVKRMSIHSWIGRLINRANVPAFERTMAEMPLYCAGKSSAQKAISKSRSRSTLLKQELNWIPQYIIAEHQTTGQTTLR